MPNSRSFSRQNVRTHPTHPTHPPLPRASARLPACALAQVALSRALSLLTLSALADVMWLFVFSREGSVPHLLSLAHGDWSALGSLGRLYELGLYATVLEVRAARARERGALLLAGRARCRAALHGAAMARWVARAKLSSYDPPIAGSHADARPPPFIPVRAYSRHRTRSPTRVVFRTACRPYPRAPPDRLQLALKGLLALLLLQYATATPLELAAQLALQCEELWRWGQRLRALAALAVALATLGALLRPVRTRARARAMTARLARRGGACSCLCGVLVCWAHCLACPPC